ncbi:hypothetical protein EJ08DRAFT_699994 [Tothia fuscella]|uniref:Uncharacterized protein n=1 Tax=Tothia fuscella TaxID=1048955 RepID=A0A9P4NLJ9_9PEZI|nr:hypothetical protein EJ08DRAFT_699994 [Tothia fuscella]
MKNLQQLELGAGRLLIDPLKFLELEGDMVSATNAQSLEVSNSVLAFKHLFHSLIAYEITMPCRTTLKLQGALVSSANLLQFLARHKDTIQNLEFVELATEFDGWQLVFRHLYLQNRVSNKLERVKWDKLAEGPRTAGRLHGGRIQTHHIPYQVSVAYHPFDANHPLYTYPQFIPGFDGQSSADVDNADERLNDELGRWVRLCVRHWRDLD